MRKIYKILGEDPNCDFGGSHIMPTLGYVEGEYYEVLEYAKTLKNWKTWGRGGKIEIIEVVPIEEVYNKEMSSLEKQIREKEIEIEELRKKKYSLEKRD